MNKNEIIINIEKTNNPKLQLDYYQLRHHVYQNTLGLDLKIDEADRLDNISDCFIATNEGKVIAGARLTISSPQNRILLPLEIDIGRCISSLTPKLELQDKTYCEISKLVVAKEYRNRIVTEQLLTTITKSMIEQNCTYHFSISTIREFRNFRQIFKTALHTKHEILNNIKVEYLPEYKHLNRDGIHLCLTELPEPETKVVALA